jgi:hypothetical protein
MISGKSDPVIGIPYIEPNIEANVGSLYMPILKYPILKKLNPIFKLKLNQISVSVHANIGISDIERNVKPDIGYSISDIVS